MKPEIRFWILVSLLVLVILATTLPSCDGQDNGTQPAVAQICFPQGSDILVSNTNEIPNRKIIETKTFVMISKVGRSNLCEAAVAFLEQVRNQGGNAVIGLSFMTVPSVDPRIAVVLYGTAVVVEPLDDQLSNE